MSREVDELIERIAQGNRERKRAHPDWPTHKAIFYPPCAPPELHSESVPVRKWDGAVGYCKYCYETHANWWLMDQEDYQVPGTPREELLTIVLCGECEHTSAIELMDTWEAGVVNEERS